MGFEKLGKRRVELHKSVRAVAGGLKLGCFEFGLGYTCGVGV